MTHHAWLLLHALGRWSTGSVDKFSEELGIDSADLQQAVRELRTAGLLVAFSMQDDTPFDNAMLEISQKGLDFIEEQEGHVGP